MTSTRPDLHAASRTATMPFRFGAKSIQAASGTEWAETARRIEGQGFSTLLMDDHLFWEQLSPVPALAMAAAATTTLKVGTHVAAVDFRNPVLFAREIATLDLLSGGRTEFGLGAGWANADYELGGIRQDSAGVRIDRLRETVAVLRGLWSGEPFSYQGNHISLGEHQPQLASRPSIRLMLGGGGPKILRLAAETADVVGINVKVHAGVMDATSLGTVVEDEFDARVGWVREAAGDRRVELQLQILRTVVTEDPLTAATALEDRFQLPAEVLLRSPFVQIGTVEQIVENLHRIRERWGVSYFVVHGDVTPMLPVVERLADVG